MPDDTLLFFEVVRQALGETVDSLFAKVADAMHRGDFERVRGLEEQLRVAVVLGNALVTSSVKRDRT